MSNKHITRPSTAVPPGYGGVRCTSMLRSFLVSSIYFSLTACSINEDAPIKIFDTKSGIIDLSEQIGGEWDKVCIIPPYSSNEFTRKIIGFDFDTENRSSVYALDNISLLIVLSENQVIYFFETPRKNVDFSSLGAGCFKKAAAKFGLKKGNNELFQL